MTNNDRWPRDRKGVFPAGPPLERDRDMIFYVGDRVIYRWIHKFGRARSERTNRATFIRYISHRENYHGPSMCLIKVDGNKTLSRVDTYSIELLSRAKEERN